MDAKQIRQINVERLGNWTHKMVSSHATPLILIGVGHDHVSGKPVLCTIEEMKDNELAAFLLNAAREVGAQTAHTVVPKEYFDKLMYLVSFLGILVRRAGGELTIEHLSEVAGTQFELGMDLDPEHDRATLVTIAKQIPH